MVASAAAATAAELELRRLPSEPQSSPRPAVAWLLPSVARMWASASSARASSTA